MPRCIYLAHKDLHTSVDVRFAVSSRLTATLLLDQDTVHNVQYILWNHLQLNFSCTKQHLRVSVIRQRLENNDFVNAA